MKTGTRILGGIRAGPVRLREFDIYKLRAGPRAPSGVAKAHQTPPGAENYVFRGQLTPVSICVANQFAQKHLLLVSCSALAGREMREMREMRSMNPSGSSSLRAVTRLRGQTCSSTNSRVQTSHLLPGSDHQGASNNKMSR